MSVSKKYLKTKPVCKVTFRMPKEAVNGASKVTIAGDFNDWDTSADELKKLKNGSFKTTIDLEKGKEYQYKFLLDGQKWENDWEADKYAPSGIGAEENSVVIV